MPADTIRWGILGPGNIANAFATGLRSAPGARLVAVGSRTKEHGDAFADKFDIPRRHVGYEALAADPEVDIIYVATPHSMHRDATRLCLSHGKAVLCEKPFTINAGEAQEVIDLARTKGLFLMEAMWTRFFPLMARLRQIIADGVIGKAMLLQADFGFRAEFDPRSRLFDPGLGGGALLDVGVYPVSLASMLFGVPARCLGMTCLGQSGVDELSAMLLAYEGERMAVLATAVRANTAQEAMVTGSGGRIRVHSQWWKPSTMTLSAGGRDDVIEVPYEGNGFNYEALEAMHCLREGRTESDVLPLDETLEVVRTMDTLRAQWGLKYPGE
jgi:predicted dehydrogenase